jgi:UDP-N-acetylglucosamine--N-acetylmuramyl-(pentapeptide) pyrophosphoryl-undecaprenol N-acetylglucosamine transferase
LAAQLTQAMADQAGLTQRAQAARSAGAPDAAERLADLVIDIIQRARKPETAA